MWKGRFQQETSGLVQRYGESISFDWRLYPYDIMGSMAHAEALAKARIITKAELQEIHQGLKGIQADIEAGNFEWRASLEDVHMNIESVLTSRIGAAGAKLHTARSRNDQVALDVRLYCRAEARNLITLVRGLQRALVGQGQRWQHVVMPGYTHLQRGQPVLFSHHLLAYVEMLDRDAARLEDCLKRINVMPLGSGALAGSTIVLDREFVAKKLGFDGVTHNSMDAVADRDFAAELIFAIALCGTHLSRLSEDIILWVTAEFGFVTLSDAHTTGSSLMPQKKNPDVAELTRGKTGRLYGNLMSILTILKGLPLTYNRDMQEDKEPLFDSIDTLKIALEVYAEMIDGLKVNEKAVASAVGDPFLLATDLADYLVLRGVPFRQAHEIIGKLTAHSLATGIGFPDITLENYQSFSPVFERNVFKVLTLEHALEARKGIGAPSPANAASELEAWRTRLSLRKPAVKTKSSRNT
ncbi:MAG: argh: argininosuccinate lyase [Verrucomicrobiales bacterium]|nr:argh: argininosuccinate lyase [Verrucomicrobiales bacterium]